MKRMQKKTPNDPVYITRVWGNIPGTKRVPFDDLSLTSNIMNREKLKNEYWTNFMMFFICDHQVLIEPGDIKYPSHFTGFCIIKPKNTWTKVNFDVPLRPNNVKIIELFGEHHGILLETLFIQYVEHITRQMIDYNTVDMLKSKNELNEQWKHNPVFEAEIVFKSY